MSAVVSQLPGFVGRLDQGGHQVVLGLSASRFDEPGEVVGEARRGLFTLSLDLWRNARHIPTPGEVVEPAVEHRQVFSGNAQDLADHRGGERIREVTHEVDPAQLGRAIEQLVDHLLHQAPVARDGARGEVPGDHPANAGVILGSHVEEQPAHHVVEGPSTGARVEDLGIPRIADQRPVGEHLERVGETREHPRGSAVEGRGAVARLELSQTMQIGVELPAPLGVEDDLEGALRIRQARRVGRQRGLGRGLGRRHPSKLRGASKNSQALGWHSGSCPVE
jgi:hypothetical protein